MARKKPTKPIAKAESAVSDLLDAFFTALSDADRSKLLLSICDGVVTGAALSDKLGWRRDETSRQVRVLRQGGLIEAKRERRWVRLVPQLAGVAAAKAFVQELRANEPPSTERPPASPEERLRRAQVLANPGRRSLLTQVRTSEAAPQSELARACGLSPPQVSRGLAELVKCGLLTAEREGRLARHSASFEAIESLWGWLASSEARLTKGRAVATALILPKPAAAKVSSEAQTPEPDEAPPVGPTSEPAVRA